MTGFFQRLDNRRRITSFQSEIMNFSSGGMTFDRHTDNLAAMVIDYPGDIFYAALFIHHDINPG